MIEARLDPATVARVRLTASPALETSSWLALTLAGRSHPVLGDVGPAARLALRDRDVALTATLALGGLRGGYVPDFLTPKPMPGPAERTFADQLERVRASDPGAVEAQLQLLGRSSPRVGAALAHFGPSATLVARVTLGLATFWRAVVADDWVRVAACAESDVRRRTEVLARAGTEGLLNSLHPAVRWTGSRLLVDKPYSETVQYEDDEVVLVPSVGGGLRLAVQLCDPADATVAYPAGWADPAPGAQRTRSSAVADRGGDDTDRRGDVVAPETPGMAAALLGRGRGTVFAALTVPRTTTELHELLGLSASTVSQHLRVLTAAGLLERSRQGRLVHYRLSSAGRALLNLGGDDRHRAAPG
ncbi:MAG: DUF5937 family protein [bacterium]